MESNIVPFLHRHKISVFIGIVIFIFIANVVDLYRLTDNRPYQFKYHTQSDLRDTWMTGSIIYSRYFGLFHNASFSKRYIHNSCQGSDVSKCFTYQMCQFQYDEMLYESGQWETYKSSLRFIPSFYTIVDHVWCDISGGYSDTIWLIELIETALYSIVLGLFVYYLLFNFGFAVCFSALIFIIISPEFNNVNVITSNWVRYLSFALVPLITKALNLSSVKQALACFIVLVAIVFGLNQSIQYELTTVVGFTMIGSVILGYEPSFNNRYRMASLIKVTSITMILAMLLILVIHYVCLTSYFSSLDKSYEWFMGKFIQRTHPDLFQGNESSYIFDNQYKYKISPLRLFIFDLFNLDVIKNFKSIHFICIYLLGAFSLYICNIKGWIKWNLRKEKVVRLQILTLLAFFGLFMYYMIFTSHAAGHPIVVATFPNYGFTLLAVVSFVASLSLLLGEYIKHLKNS